MKIALIGYGKMGRMIEEIALSRGHEIVSIIDIDNQADFDSPAFKSADVAIEFTAPHVAYENYLKAFRHHVKVVSGSTGWMDKHGEDVRRMCAEEGQTLFWSSNFSLGVAVFRAVSRHLAQIMNRYDDYKPVMEEVHHVHKLDHPSGTAITLAEELVARGHEVRFAGTPTGIESRLVPAAGFAFEPFEAAGFNRSHPLSLVKALKLERVPVTVVNGKKQFPGGKTMAELTGILSKYRD
jgi:dihydrodipicolinate reductase